jgi:hypothetical protein
MNKDMFGKPGEGVHSYRIFNIAIVDVLATIAIGLLLSWLFPKVNVFLMLLGLFLLGILLHRWFGVRTTIDKLLFPSFN